MMQSIDLGWDSCPFQRRLGWDLTAPVLDLLPSGFYTVNPTETHVLSWSQFTDPPFCSKPALVQTKISGSFWPLSWMTGCHHKLSLAGAKLWVFPSHLLKYHRQHYYFVCHPEIRGTDFLSGHHTKVTSNSSIEEQTVSFCCISTPTQYNL